MAGFCSIALWAIAWTLLVEYVSRDSARATLSWATGKMPWFLLSVILAGSVWALLAALTAAPAFSRWLLSVLALLLAAASAVKQAALGVPILPWDLALVTEVAGFVPHLPSLLNLPVAAALFLLVLGEALLQRLDPLRFRLRTRAAFAAGAAAVLMALWFAQTGGLPADQTGHVAERGFTLATFRNLRLYMARRPERASEPVSAAPTEDPGADVTSRAGDPETDAASPDGAPGASTDAAPGPAAVRPNLVLVLSESFWDPTQLPGVTFSRDPIPVFRALSQTHTSGWMLSPQFGGMTANVELEVLTGLSVRFLPEGVVAYNHFITRPVESLASILGGHGYSTTAITPWPRWFFKGEQVYRLLGFSRLISVEFMRPVYHGPYIADSEVARIIIEESRTTPGPDMIFANTAENHFHYEPGKFPANTIQVQGLSGYSRGMLETFAQGCASADEMLKALVSHFESTGEPTILVFFGDHLPYLGAGYRVYREAGYISGPEDPRFVEKMYRVPVLVWSNYLPERTSVAMGTSFLPPYLLDLAGIRGTDLTDLLRDMFTRIPAIPPRKDWAGAGIDEQDLAPYAALQNEMLFGEGRETPGTRDFVLGYGPLALHRAVATGSTLQVEGANLPPTAVVFADGRPLPTEWIDFYTLQALLPPSGATQVAVRVLDPRRGDVILETAPVRISTPPAPPVEDGSADRIRRTR